ncbi:hypothetical protein DTO207G8_9174 [Paecilomyces variotii]|nr:hypothetical protein DTO207G8_9174 [Paecilomyces variotii]KAJ9247182.1 hypothetical protein DTO195F2_9197 [Paecilomyces variotii]KAJ9367286.1 hypothetical protein DTO282E5_8002 [Paecilomyces variotii]KAJ9386789.1 hypothetical protein DTO063F5_3447 [Paecilomyces variotii]
MASPTILLPGDNVPSNILPSSTGSTPMKLGSGLRILSQQNPTIPSSRSKPSGHTITATQAGLLTTDAKRNAVSLLSFPNRRYVPTVHDLVIAQVNRSSPDYFHCTLTPHAPQVMLGQLAFEGATKKTRPMLKAGDLVYARVLSVGVGAGAEVEITCVNPTTGKADGGLGPLTGGMLFEISTGLAARLMKPGASEIVILDELGARFKSKGGFEIAIGRNGKVWVDCSNSGDNAVKMTVAIGRCLVETDERKLNTADQKKLVAKILRDMKIDA